MGCVSCKPLRKEQGEVGDSPLEKTGSSSASRSSSLASRRLVTPTAATKETDSEHEGSEWRSKQRKNAVGIVPVGLLAEDGEKQRHQYYPRQQQVVIEEHYQPRQVVRQSGELVISVNGGNSNPRNPPRHTEGEQVAAGWPVWLTAVAGEAIKGWIPRRADSFEKLDKIGQGTYSNVYKARDLDTGKIVALKKVRFDNLEPDSVRFMAREIQVLRRLDHPNVVKLEGLVTSRLSCSLYLVFEYMEHDLAGLAACPGIKFTEAQVKCYLQQLLRGLDHCHSQGVLHRDIKGSNLLIDNSGILKIADFGLATFFHPDQRQALTSRVVTLWYRPPELLLGATEYGVAVDLWSTGCILAELLAGKPIMPGRTEVEQLHKIFKLCGSPSEEYWKRSRLPHATIFKPQQPYKRCVAETYKDFPASALALMEMLLAIEPADRGTAGAALKSEFFTSKPFPCDPSSLPKYPPCKEFDAKIRDEEARRRQRAAGGGRGHREVARRGSQESRAVPAPEANAELAASIQKRRLMAQGSSKSKSEKFNARQDDAVGFPIEPPRALPLPTTENAGNSHSSFQQTGTYHSEVFSNPSSSLIWTKKPKEDGILMAPGHSLSRPSKVPVVMDLKKQGVYGPQSGGDLSNSSALTLRSSTSVDKRKEQSSLYQNSGSSEFRDIQERPNRQNWVQFHQQESFKGLDNYCLPDMPITTHRKDERVTCKEPNMGYSSQGDRIHYSGPLIPQTGNIDVILKEHERHIQNVVRRARQDKGRPQKASIFQTKRKSIEQKDLVSVANGITASSDLVCEVPSSIGSSRLKQVIAKGSDEIGELKDSDKEPLSSVIENYERERDL